MAATDRQNGIVADIAVGSSGISDVTAPTVAEITALTRLECGVIDAPSTDRNGSTIDISGLCDLNDRYKSGNIRNEPIEATLWREFDGTDTYWAACDDSNVSQTLHMVICRAGFTGAAISATNPANLPAASDVVDVYTVTIMSRSPQRPVRGEAQRFTAMWAVTQVDFDVTVAA